MDNEEIISDESLSDRSTTDVEEVASTTYHKRKKQVVIRRKNKFSDSWKNKFSWVTRTNKESMAKCIVCGICFSIANSVITGIKRHMKTAKHMRNLGSYQQKPVSRFFNNSSNKETQGATEASSMAEAAFVYHTITHSHSYQSADCSN
ncbi:uncharacterized protein LOC119604292 [Lucilia sericata]|uniref:uncharacterized protein LOC119604292 n=1 Tax=Lucilia sericata TaxID=13632 RepID=UPI0018A87BA3|nr:uncharacterized protein LOC119604292 [Lucilia sericata]